MSAGLGLAGRVCADLRLAWQLARGQSGRLWLLVACIAVGVAARVCVGSFSDRVEGAIAREARPLLGGDLEVAGNTPLPDERVEDLRAQLPSGAASARQVSFLSVATAASGRSQLVDIRGVEPAHPLGGRTRAIDAAGAEVPVAALFGAEPTALVGRDLLERLGVAVGGEITLGKAQVRIAGVLTDDPGMGANPFAPGPRVLIAYDRVGETGLTGSQARARWSVYVVLDAPGAAEALAERLRTRWDLPSRSRGGIMGRVEAEGGIEVRTARESQQSLSRFFSNLGEFLRLVSLASLLLGGVGVASVVRAFVAERLDSVAALQVLGAAPGRVARIFLIQALATGAFGGAVGAVAGSLVQNVLIWVLSAKLPVAVGFGIDLGACMWGVALGALTAAVFAALPLLEVRRMPPLAILRGDAAAPRARLLALAVALAGGAAFAVVAAYESDSWIRGPIFVAGLAAGAITVSLLGMVLLPLVARIRPPWFGARHGLANLGRRGFRPGAALVAISLAALVFGSTLLHQASLSRELDPARRGDLPSLFCVDIQDDQREAFAALAQEHAGQPATMAPMIMGRLRSVAGSAPRGGARAAVEGAAARDAEWARSREQRLSWRHELGRDEEIVEGEWMRDDPERFEASIEQRFAERINARVGDAIVFEVQGVSVEATVTSLRKVRWQGARPNFFVLLSPSALSGAPTTWVGAVPAMAPEARNRLQTALAQSFPNVTAIDISDVVTRVRWLVDRIAEAVRLMGWFALAAGLVVVLGIGLSTARERQVDAALIGVLGGRPRTLAASLVCEFGALGLLGGIVGLSLALGLAYVQVQVLLEIELAIPWLQLGALAAVVAVITAAAGLIACRRALTAPPLQALRDG